MQKISTSSSTETGELDVLFVHVPRFQNYYPALNVHSSCNRMALGLIALADLINRNGFSTRLIHGGIELQLDKNFSFESFLLRHRPKIIGFSQHFHHNLVDTLQWASLAKKVLPDCFVTLGGFTSTFFSREIMEKAPFVDAVCRGDSEVPLLELCKRVIGEQSRNLDKLPNFIWRKDAFLQENEQSYAITEEVFDDLNFTNFQLLDHAKVYIDMPKAPVRTNIPGRFDHAFNYLTGKDKGNIYWGLPVGRGCLYNCCYCGGGAKAQQKINHRKGFIARKHDDVIKSIRELVDFGFEGSYVSFDPTPKWTEEFYGELFRRLRAEKLNFNLLFSSWRLPTCGFLDEFARTFGERSAVLVSPETGSDQMRKISRPNGPTNMQLLEMLQYADDLGIRTTVYFSIGAMEKSMDDFNETLALKKQIEDRFTRARVEGFLVEAEPGAAWHFDPEKYGINLLRSTFDDFIRVHSDGNYSSMTHLGYTSSLFGDKNIEPEEFYNRLLKLRCKHFCDKNLSCAIMKGVWSACRGVGLAPKPQARSIEGFLY
jgi:radical SAM superfamily enzyme YgiQ (UPF0313 family)